MTVIPDTTTAFGARVERRLREEAVAWLTLVDPNGTPQPAPIWFLWDGVTALVYSDRNAKRLDHLRTNPRVALHFDGNGRGGDIVVLTGRIVEDVDAPAPQDNHPYLAKYGDQIAGGSWRTAEVFAETYAVPLRFTPHRIRGHRAASTSARPWGTAVAAGRLRPRADAPLGPQRSHLHAN